ncbi:MAG: ATP-binding protein [Planctomycetes bacterium]|nr:ATP-binding protein [Planctomycetota bacterium]
MRTFDELRPVTHDSSGLQRLMNDHVCEGPCLDYKREPYRNNDHEEARRDATAFANHRGGFILVGVEEDRTTGAALIFSPIADAHQVANRLRDILSDLIEPRLSDIEVFPVNIADGSVIVVQIPPSDKNPHAVRIATGRYEWWVRQDRSKREMRFDEIIEGIRRDTVRREHIRLLEAGRTAGCIVQPILDAGREPSTWSIIAVNGQSITLQRQASSSEVTLPLAAIAEITPAAAGRPIQVHLNRGCIDINAQEDRWCYLSSVSQEALSRLEKGRELERARVANWRATVTPHGEWPAENLPFTIVRVDKYHVRLQGRSCANAFPIPIDHIRQTNAMPESRTMNLELDMILGCRTQDMVGYLRPITR